MTEEQQLQNIYIVLCKVLDENKAMKKELESIRKEVADFHTAYLSFPN